MEGLGTILKLKIDSVESAYSDDEPGTLDKLKCCVCDILTLYSQVLYSIFLYSKI